MRPLYIYLTIYFLLLIGAAVALWQSGVLARMSPVSVLLTAIVVFGLGVIVALTASPTATRQ